MRDAPSVTIINHLLKEGAVIYAYDPIAMKNAKRIISGITYCNDSYSAAENSDILIILTEWNEFRQLDLEKIKGIMRQAIILDGRNIYEPQKVKDIGFVYQGVGR